MKRILHDHFIPHEGNEYAPHILQKAALLGMALLITLSFTMANLQALFWVSSEWMVSTILPAVVVAETNEAREQEALTSLRRSAVLDQAAQLKAEDMMRNQYFAHYSPAGVSPWHWFAEADYAFVHAGENLAVHFTDSTAVVDAWLDSPTHRANILNGDYREIGIGVAEGTFEGYQTVFVVQLFGTPAQRPQPVAVAPAPVPVVAAEEISVEATAEAITPSLNPTPVLVVQPDVATETPVITIPSETEVAVVAGLEDAVVVEESRSQEQIVVATTPEVEIATASPSSTDIAAVTVEQDVIVAHSDFISTSTGGIPASIDGNASDSAGTTKPFLSFVTQPQLVLQILYSILGVFVLGALLLSILIEIRRQQPVQIAYGIALLGLMYGLYTVHVAVTAGVTII